jgi:hypothetical protein
MSRDPVPLHLLGRIANVALSLVATFLAYIMGKRLFGSRVGLLSSAILSLSPLYIQWTQILRSDILLTLLTLCVLLCCISIAERDTWKSYLSSGLFLGLAIATKYTAALLALSVIAAHLARWWPDPKAIVRNGHRLIAAGLISLAATILGSPFLLLDFSKAASDFTRVSNARWWFHMADGPVQTLAWYFSGPVPRALSLAGLIALAVGTFYGIRKQDRRLWAIIVFMLSSLTLLGSLKFYWSRFIVPLLPCMAVFSAHGVCIAWERMDRIGRPFLRYPGIAILLMAVFFPIVLTTMREGIERGRNPIQEATEWTVANIPPGSRLLIDSKTVQLPPDRYSVYHVDARGNVVPSDRIQAEQATNPDALEGGGAAGRKRRKDKSGIALLKNPEEIHAHQIDYIMMGIQYDRLRKRLAFKSKGDPDTIQIAYQDLMQRHALLHTINAETPRLTVDFPMLKGYYIRIYKTQVPERSVEASDSE